MSSSSLRGLLCGTTAIVVAILMAGVWMWSSWYGQEEARRLKAAVLGYHNGAELCNGIGTVALRSTNVSEVVDCLRRLTPSTATPPWADSPPPDSTDGRLYDLLDKLRSLNRQAVISHLRSLTGDDLGDDTLAWIKKYGNQSKQP